METESSESSDLETVLEISNCSTANVPILTLSTPSEHDTTPRAIPKTSRKSCNKEGKYKEFRCTYCGKHFSHKGNMQKHMRTHTQEKSFMCTVCGVCYRKSSHLLEHCRRHRW